MAKAKYLVLLGPDGSGKTTVANELGSALRADGWNVTHMAFSFGILPSLSRLRFKRVRRITCEGQRDSGMVMPLSKGRAIVLALWYGIDHILGAFWIASKSQEDVIIFARSYHDFMYQRAYLHLPSLIPTIFLKFGPKPVLMATPFRDPKVIHRQKPELSVEEIREQYGRIKARLGSYPCFLMIDATSGVDKVVCEIRENIT